MLSTYRCVFIQGWGTYKNIFLSLFFLVLIHIKWIVIYMLAVSLFLLKVFGNNYQYNGYN